jgi:hypothetical protein
MQDELQEAPTTFLEVCSLLQDNDVAVVQEVVELVQE